MLIISHCRAELRDQRGLDTLKFARIEVKISKSKQSKNHAYDFTQELAVSLNVM